LLDFDLLPVSFRSGGAGLAFLEATFFWTAFLPGERAATI